MRERQKIESNVELSSRQKQDQIAKANSKIVGLNKIPVNLFEENTIGKGLLGTGKIKPRPKLPIPFVESTNNQKKPLLKEVDKFSYCSREYFFRVVYIVDTLNSVTKYTFF